MQRLLSAPAHMERETAADSGELKNKIKIPVFSETASFSPD